MSSNAVPILARRARRLATIIAERLQGMRRAVAQFERYFKTVYGGKK